MQEEFSLLLKKARKKAGFTQKELADILGVATGTVQQWELGTRFPRVGMLKNIENTLKISLIPSDNEDERKHKRKEEILEAWKAAELKAGKKLSLEEAMEFYKIETAVYVRFNEAIKKLNNEGLKVAFERIEELTLIDKYTLPDIEKYLHKRSEPPETIYSADMDKDTTKTKSPSESHTEPSNGQ